MNGNGILGAEPPSSTMIGLEMLDDDKVAESEPRDLTAQEKRWVNRLRKVMADCPDTLDLMTIGDPVLVVLNRSLARNGPIEDGYAERRGAVLARVRCACPIHGVSG